MRSFDVIADGVLKQVRADDFIRPIENDERQWIFIDARGEPLSAWPAAAVTSVTECVEYVGV